MSNIKRILANNKTCKECCLHSPDGCQSSNSNKQRCIDGDNFYIFINIKDILKAL
jgi:hypothetical protein